MCSNNKFSETKCLILIVDYICWSGITLWPQTSGVNTTDYLFIMTHVSGWDILGCKWTYCLWIPLQSLRVKGSKMGKLRIWVSLTRAKLWWLDDWIRAAPKYLSKVAQRRNSGETATGSWAAKAHWCTWGADAGLCVPIQQMSYCCSNCWRSWCWFW